MAKIKITEWAARLDPPVSKERAHQLRRAYWKTLRRHIMVIPGYHGVVMIDENAPDPRQKVGRPRIK